MGNYITVESLRAYRPRGSSSALSFTNWTDDQLDDVIDLVEKTVEDLTKDIFYSKSDTIYFSGNNRLELFIFPVIKYKLLTVVSCQEVTFSEEVLRTFVEGTNFKIKDYSLVYAYNTGVSARVDLNAGVWPGGKDNIKVVGTFGSVTVPEPIIEACHMLAVINTLGPFSAGIGTGGDSLAGKKQEVWTDYTVTYSGNDFTSLHKQQGVDNLTGYMEVDRILSQYINNVDLFMVI